MFRWREKKLVVKSALGAGKGNKKSEKTITYLFTDSIESKPSESFLFSRPENAANIQ